MRENKSFGTRSSPSNVKEVTPKYFFVYEGKKTEAIYFDAVISEKQKLSINPLLELIPIVRSIGEDGWSNPQRIITRLLENITESQEQHFSYETLTNWLIDYISEHKPETTIKDARIMFASLKCYILNELHCQFEDLSTDTESALRILIEFLQHNFNLSDLIEDIPKIIEYGDLSFDSSIDKICLIVDRDRNSFRPKQYQNVIDSCRHHQFGFYVSNPCFEFWLVLHFDDASTLDLSKLIKNEKDCNGCTYSENALRERLPTYTKTSFNARTLVCDIETAITNASNYCQDIVLLEKEVGTNLPALFSELRSL